ncbi:metallophosphoesterase family protein [Desulfocurvibacter africanus]|uniref:Phosphoesterase n=1 Tax=Desulfocurvibacter africanus subsp. africanus str. Walvis Bay TaxID=690850 RepID=F3YU99_DESAF|nr:metallophosphoesterase [Desulfocurvibacter africanus]EGJ48705.1 phosphodiesterase, MJ0936 family [Desulfocurvibacter africanus subsp. africanus str. Walvis Bay]
MLVAVLSDTHLAEPTPSFRRVFKRHIEPADAVLHCGDITGAAMLRFFEASHPAFYAVLGNCDAMTGGMNLPAMYTLELAGFRIGMAHGWGARSRVGLTVLEALGPGLDIVCYGHTHRQHWEKIGSTWLLNPGSLDLVREERPSLALLTLDSGREPLCEQVTVSGRD